MVVQFTDKYYNKAKVGTIKSLPDALARQVIAYGEAIEYVVQKPVELETTDAKVKISIPEKKIVKKKGNPNFGKKK